jgi:hypothetical protein
MLTIPAHFLAFIYLHGMGICNIYKKCVLNVKYMSYFLITFVLNIYSCSKYYTSYA